MALKYKQRQINVCFIDALMTENNLKINRFSFTKYVNGRFYQRFKFLQKSATVGLVTSFTHKSCMEMFTDFQSRQSCFDSKSDRTTLPAPSTKKIFPPLALSVYSRSWH